MRPPLQYAAMLDLIYILVTLAFFGLMVAYVHACEKLGQDGTGEEDRP
jgi:hypothetical protein